MWMMGYNDGGDLYMSDSINAGRKLRPLVPRLLAAANTAAVSTPPCLNRIHGDHHLFTLNNASMEEQNKRDFHPQQVVVSSRWNPTPEQLRVLEELYRRGTRTPSAEQIQHITAQLRRYGKIEGKNVFYWFQNHKARERQKRRREMESHDQSNRDVEILERKETGASRTIFGADQQTKNWVPPINSSTLSEKSAKGASECKSSEHHQWIGGDESQLKKNDTLQAIHLSFPAPTHRINTPKPLMDPRQLFHYNTGNSNISSPHLTPFLIPSPSPPTTLEPYSISSDDGEEEDDENSQTLELFPLRSGDFGQETDLEMSMGEISNGFDAPQQFFEFLPLKN